MIDSTSIFSGRVIRATDPDWNEARRGFCACAPYDTNVPEAVMFCRNTPDVVFAIDWAKSQNVGICIRSGRHHYEGASSLVSGGLIIDVSGLSDLEILEGSRQVRVGAGVRMLQLYETMDEQGLTLPLAMSPTVGIAGLVLGGGFGMTSRKWGLTCDRLVEVEMVLANGKLEVANEHENTDLFWACRGGGGGNFGVATSFVFEACTVGSCALVQVDYAWDHFAEVVERFQAWAPTSDQGIGSFLTLDADRKISMTAQFSSKDRESVDLQLLFAEMLDSSLGPQIRCLEILPHSKMFRTLLEIDDSLNSPLQEQLFKSTSSFAFEPLPNEAIRILKDQLEGCPALKCPGHQPSMIQLLAGGGKIAALDAFDTAAYHRRAKLVLQFNGYWSHPGDEAKTVYWVQDSRAALLPFTAGAYVNYADSSLAEPLESYYGENLNRLKAVKQKYDPTNVFNGMQSIPAS